MKVVITLAIALGILWLVGVTVIAVWPVVTDAPWEDGGPSTSELQCQNALERRATAEASLGIPLDPGGDKYGAVIAQEANQERLARLQDIIAAAEQDIATFCH